MTVMMAMKLSMTDILIAVALHQTLDLVTKNILVLHLQNDKVESYSNASNISSCKIDSLSKIPSLSTDVLC